MSKAHIPPAVAIRGWNLFGEKEKEKRKKKGQIKGLISHMWLILLYTVQPVIPDVCTKFQNPRSSSSWEIFDENFHIYYLERLKKEKIEKGKNKSRHLGFVLVTHLVVPILYTKFKDSGSNRSWEICNRKFC